MSTNPLYASLDMLISPVTALETVKDKKGWWLVPFVLCTGSLVGLFLYYFANVDFAWLKETMVDQMALNKDMRDEELQAVSDYFTKTPLLWSTTIGGSLVVYPYADVFDHWYDCARGYRCHYTQQPDLRC